jgi:hypothetical protein
MSFFASIMSRPGKPPPVELGFTGLEMKARKVRPLLVWVLEFEEPPHEISPMQSTMKTKRELKDLFNPGTPRFIGLRELDATKGGL